MFDVTPLGSTRHTAPTPAHTDWQITTMFVLVTVRDHIVVHPSTFDRDIHEVLTEQIDAKYGNKVLPDVGLVVCLHSFVKVDKSLVYANLGSATTQVTANLLVFSPHADEVIVGTVKGSSSSGVQGNPPSTTTSAAP